MKWNIEPSPTEGNLIPQWALEVVWATPRIVLTGSRGAPLSLVKAALPPGQSPGPCLSPVSGWLLQQAAGCESPPGAGVQKNDGGDYGLSADLAGYSLSLMTF